MQVVIEISDHIYDDIMVGGESIGVKNLGMDAIRNGTPLSQYCEQCCLYYPSESEDD